jgi:HAD superfamily hydrolase (TIGR01509 family)
MRGVIFDLDGTIVENAYDWGRIKEELGSGESPILEYIEGLDEPERSRKMAILEKHEVEQTRGSILREGMGELLDFLSEKRILKALVTNNSMENVRILIDRFNLKFDVEMSRESGLRKPSGAPFVEAMKTMNLRPEDVRAVGDSPYDVRAARDAGIAGIYIFGGWRESYSGTPVRIVSSAFDLLELFRAELG